MTAMVNDPTMPFLAAALTVEQAERAFSDHLGPVRVLDARLLRHKPGRRCLIEYQIDMGQGIMPVIGKIRAKGLDRISYATQHSLWRAGLPVPEPMGVVPEFQMWLQRKVLGETVASLLAGPEGVALADRIAGAAFELHQVHVPTSRRHSIDDELRILQTRLGTVAGLIPRLAPRIERISAACFRIGAGLSDRPATGIHRDFYPDQVIVAGPRLVLLDFDLYCLGDPALDIGNFIGHITEQSLRYLGDPSAWACREQALADRYQALIGEEHCQAIQSYATLTLVRHIQLSTQFPERRQWTDALIDLCEQRLDNDVLGLQRTFSARTTS